MYQQDPVESVLEVGGVGVSKDEEAGGGGVGADGGPVCKVGRGLEHVGLVGDALEAQLKLPAGRVVAQRGEVQGLHQKLRAGGDTVVKVRFKSIGRDRLIARQVEHARIQQRIGRGQRAVQRVVERRVGVGRREGDAHRGVVAPAAGRDDRRRQRRHTRQAVDPVVEHLHRVGVNLVARQRRHLDGCGIGIHPGEQHRTPDIVRLDDARIVHPQRERRRVVRDVLLGERRVVARVERDARPARPVALRAVRVQIGARPFFQRRGEVGQRRKLFHVRDA